jgi:S1-C subfamily serine protease
VVAIMGAGHLRGGYGAPHQLRALGIADPAVLLPWDVSQDCALLTTGIADLVFGVEDRRAEAAERPRLGVMLDQGEQGVTIRDVLKGSIAESAGARAGDVIKTVAGMPVKDTGTVIAVVQRQAPGTWLPITVQRGALSLELVARFPGKP